jgi:hypothetical protein
VKATARFETRLLQLFNALRGGPGPKSGPFRRFLSRQDADRLARRLGSALGTSVSRSQVQNTAALLRQVEKQMVGRVAGDVDDHILNYHMIGATAHIAAPATIAHGEIGVLFGGSLLMTLHALRNSGSDHHVLAIDPFEGYYGQGPDPVMRLPITVENVRHNISLFGFDKRRILLVPAKSESVEAVKSVKGVSLATLWIDGDHSYEGVARDWLNYTPSVVKGGFVLIDNYHDGDFPGVDKFVDEDLLPHLLGWEVVTTFGRSILFRKTADKAASIT